MAHSKTTCSHTSAYAELAVSGGPYAAITTPAKPWDQSTLCRVAGQNPFSFWGQDNLNVNATTKVVEMNTGAPDKLGDFRGYNHDAAIPTPPTNFTHSFGPGGINTDITMVFTVPELNILNANANADHIRYNAYTTSARRSAAATNPGLNRFDTDEEDWVTGLSNTETRPTDHTRTQTTKIQPTCIGTFQNFDVSGHSGDTVYYFDLYFADGGSDTRLVSLADTVANGYFEVTIHERQIPWADSVGTCVTNPSYTGAHTEINNVSGTSGSCTGADVNQTFGSTDYSFYARVVGFSSGSYNLGPSNCTAQIQHYRWNGTSYNVIETITKTGFNLNSGSSAGVRIHSNATGGTWADLSNAFQYDDYLKFNITAVTTWGTAYVCV